MPQSRKIPHAKTSFIAKNTMTRIGTECMGDMSLCAWSGSPIAIEGRLWWWIEVEEASVEAFYSSTEK